MLRVTPLAPLVRGVKNMQSPPDKGGLEGLEGLGARQERVCGKRVSCLTELPLMP